MDPIREPRPSAAEPAAHDILTDDAVVAHLRARAPGLPTTRFDPRAVTSRARAALRRRRRLRTSLVAGTSAVTAAYLALLVAGPVPVPGVGTMSVPGAQGLRALVGRLVPGEPPGPGEWQGDVDRLEKEVLPVVQELRLNYYLLDTDRQCRILEYPRGNYDDGGPDCGDQVPLDAQARVDFDKVTDAVKRSGVTIERIFRVDGGVYVQLPDNSWQYNYEYAYLPDGGSPPASQWPEDRWTQIRGNWWFHRAHDD